MDLHLWKLAKLLSDVIIPFIHPPGMFAFSSYSTPFAVFGVGTLFNFILIGIKWYLIMVSVFIFLITNDTEYLFMSLAIYLSSFVNGPLKYLSI